MMHVVTTVYASRFETSIANQKNIKSAGGVTLHTKKGRTDQMEIVTRVKLWMKRDGLASNGCG